MKIRSLARRVKEICTIDTFEELCYLLRAAPFKVNLLMQHPPYSVFKVPKKNGSMRTIEDPSRELKRIQDKLNDFIQPLYFFHRSAAAYGYIIRPDDATTETRNILTHARQHCNHSYLLNIDVLDFFHYVSWQIVFDALTAPPFKLHDQVAKTICHLCTLNGRLPMGAPTSPGLSNIATFRFDMEMEQYCRGENLLFTRYVDDMSFSSSEPIAERHFEQISQIILRHGYALNPQKIKWFAPHERKVITGLIVHDGKVSVPAEYQQEVEKEIGILKAYVLTQARLFPGMAVEYAFCKPAQKIRGALAFIESVHGGGYEPLHQMQKNFEEAVEPPAEYESHHWLDIGYEIF